MIDIERFNGLWREIKARTINLTISTLKCLHDVFKCVTEDAAGNGSMNYMLYRAGIKCYSKN